MDDQRILKVLEEIRDLQRQHVENYKHALENQRESIQFNEKWQRKHQRAQVFGWFVLLAVLVGLWASAIANR